MSIKIMAWLDGAGGRRAVLFGMVIYLLWAAWLTSQTSHIVQCQAKYAESYSAAAMGRAAAAVEDRRAVDDMIGEIVKIRDGGSNDTTPALKRYLQIREATDKTRADHPLPPAPSVFCS